MNSDEKFYVYSDQTVRCPIRNKLGFYGDKPTRKSIGLNLTTWHASKIGYHKVPEEKGISGKSSRRRKNSVLLTVGYRINVSRFPNTIAPGEPERRFSLPIMTDYRIHPHNTEKIRRISRLTKTLNNLNKRGAKARFRLIARLAIFCSRQAKLHCVRERHEDDDLSPFIKQLHFWEYSGLDKGNDGKLDLIFDPSKFKADRQIRISEDIKRILCNPIEVRTDQELYSVQIALRNMPFIAEYPARMQMKIAEVVRYERYEAKRVIVRQGHPASSFYFILSGVVVVMVMDVQRNNARPVAYLSKGHNFGELAIINRSMRQSTVIAKETCQFLSISVDDYHKIFMLGGVKTLTDPDHTRFLRNLDFLENWPIERLQSNPSKCLFLYFKRGEVLAKDSHYYDWIIVVKSGSIQILKKLRRVKAYGSTETDNVSFISDKMKREHLEQRNQWRQNILPEIRIPLIRNDSTDSLNDCDIVEKSFKHPYTNHTEHCKWRRLKIFPEKWKVRKRMKSKYGKSNSVIVSVNTDCDGDDVDKETAMSDRLPSLTGPAKTGSMRGLKKRVIYSDDITGPSGVRKSRSQSIEHDTDDMEQHIRTINEDLDAGNKRKDRDDITAADLNPEFVHVQTLTKGHVFGLAHLILGDQPSFCVVSNSADCILVDKKFYRENASESLMRKMRNELCPYPSEDELQSSLQTSVDWSAFRVTTLKSTLRHVRCRRMDSIN